MTLTELAQQLDSLNVPVAYSHFKEAKKPPFICYLVTSTESFIADNVTIAEIINVDIELYVEKKAPSIEKQIKDLLMKNELPFSYAENFIKSEEVFQCTFSIQLI